MNDQEVVNEFDKLYYERRSCFRKCKWMGIETQKYPTDLLVYQELIWKCRPTVIIETGTYSGGSGLYLASIMEAVSQFDPEYKYMAHIISVDIAHAAPVPKHPKIEFRLENSSVDPDWLLELKDTILVPGDKVMVILDSDHHKEHVLSELHAYAPLVTLGQYLIVEDTNINGHPVLPGWGAGPMEALEEWIKTPMANDFELDKDCEKFLLTANPGGYWRRK